MNSGIEHPLTASEPLKYVSSAMSDLIEEAPYITHLKEAQTGKYIHCNLNFAKKLGLESIEEIVGLTVNDFVTRENIWGGEKFSPAFSKWRKEQPELYRKYDEQVIYTKCYLSDQTVFFSAEGLILIQNMIKQPVLDRDGKSVIAIYTYNYEMTFRRGLFDLLQLYRQYYQEKEAIQNLLKHLKVDSYFHDLPTLQEMQILFAIRRDAHPESMARLFELPIEALDLRLGQLRNKINRAYWDELLMKLREIPVEVH